MVWTSTKTTLATAAGFDTRTGLINPPHSVLPRMRPAIEAGLMLWGQPQVYISDLF
jgi:hypothetical protein